MKDVRNERLHELSETVTEVNPFRCRMWGLHDRLEDFVTEATCKGEIDSFARHGQQLPALGRLLKGDEDFDVELIYGARRLYVARHLNKPLLVKMKELTDREALVAMELENRQRVDLSPYERGMSYTRILRTRIFQSQEELARSFGVSASQVCRLMKLAKMPSVIIASFGNPTLIAETWGVDLSEALESPARRAIILQRARTIAENHGIRPAPREVYERLIAPASEGRIDYRRGVSKGRDVEVVLSGVGKPLFRIQKRRKVFVLAVPTALMSTSVLAEIRETLSGILQRVAPEAQADSGRSEALAIPHDKARATMASKALVIRTDSPGSP